MRIRMIGHCTLVVETGGTRILTDPYFGQNGNWAYQRLAPPAQGREDLKDVSLVLVSHAHWDHVDGEYLRLLPEGTPVLVPSQARSVIGQWGVKGVVGVDVWESRHLGDVVVTAVPAVHVCPAIGYVIQSEGKQVYFSGDTYYHPFMEELGRRFQLDVALIPVTAHRVPMTMGERSAVRAVKALSPRIVIPIHLGVRPRLRPLCTGQRPEGFCRRLRDAGLACQAIVLEEDQSCEV